MTPETQRFVAQAHTCIARAQTMLTVDLREDAARTAYLSCFHVAQALIFERTRKLTKSHHGVQTEFYRLTKNDAMADPVLRRFLSQAYEFKAVADYFVDGEISNTDEQAREAVAMARRFVAHTIALIGVSSDPSDAEES